MARRATFGSVVLALAFAGCAPGNPGLVTLGVVQPNAQCLYDAANPNLGGGTLDVAAGGGYVAGLRVGNQLVNLGESGTTGPPRADPNVMVVSLLEVRLYDDQGAELDAYTVPAAGSAIPSSDGGGVSEGVVIAEIIPAIVAGSLPAPGRVLVEITAVGRTAGDAEVEAFPYTFPIELLNGGLTGCPVGDDGEVMCIATCNPGQDSFSSQGCFPPGGCMM